MHTVDIRKWLVHIPTYMVVNILDWCSPGVKDGIIVPVVDDHDSAWSQEVCKVLQGYPLIIQVALKVWQVGERVTQTNHSIKRSFLAWEIIRKGQPVTQVNF